MKTPAPPVSQPRRSTRGGTRAIYRPLTALVVRAPLLPAHDYHELGGGDDGAARGWSDPAFRFAVSVASPDLARALSARQRGRTVIRPGSRGPATLSDPGLPAPDPFRRIRRGGDRPLGGQHEPGDRPGRLADPDPSGHGVADGGRAAASRRS